MSCAVQGVRTRNACKLMASVSVATSTEPAAATGAVAIYVLRCRNDVYYVGRATRERVAARIEEHRTGAESGAEYTKRHGVAEVVSIEYFDTPYAELTVFLQMAQELGMENVRGSIYCREHHTAKETYEILKLIRGVNDLCYTCGSADHFATHCCGDASESDDESSEEEASSEEAEWTDDDVQFIKRTRLR